MKLSKSITNQEFRISRNDAIRCLRDYHNNYLISPRNFWTSREFKKRSYAQWLARILIVKWTNMPEDSNPMELLWYYYDFYDSHMLFTDSLAVIDMCELMVEICRDFSDELYSKEKTNGKRTI